MNTDKTRTAGNSTAAKEREQGAEKTRFRVIPRGVREIAVPAVKVLSLRSNESHIPSLMFADFFGTRYFVYQSRMRWWKSVNSSSLVVGTPWPPFA